MTSAGRATFVTLGVSLLVLAIKLVAYLITGSVALLSDAAESGVNVAAALAVVYAVRLAGRPPDYEHPYGHAKAEYLSGALEGSMILVAAGVILATAVGRLLAPIPLENLTEGVVVALLATAVNAVAALYLRRVGTRQRSPALVVNARHLMTDVWTSIGVLLAVALVALTGRAVIDPLIAVVVGLNIVRTGWSVLVDATSSLLDVRLPESEERVIMAVLERDPRVLGFHRLRSRQAGFNRFVEVDIFVDPRLDVITAHDIATQLEDRVIARLPNLTTTIHVEPFLEGARDTTQTPREEFGDPTSS